MWYDDQYVYYLVVTLRRQPRIYRRSIAHTCHHTDKFTLVLQEGQRVNLIYDNMVYVTHVYTTYDLKTYRAPITIERWSLQQNQFLSPWSGHSGAITDMCIHGDYLFTTAFDQTIRQWHLRSGRCVTVLKHDYLIDGLYAHGSSLFTRAGNCVRRWSLVKKRYMETIIIKEKPDKTWVHRDTLCIYAYNVLYHWSLTSKRMVNKQGVDMCGEICSNGQFIYGYDGFHLVQYDFEFNLCTSVYVYETNMPYGLFCTDRYVFLEGMYYNRQYCQVYCAACLFSLHAWPEPGLLEESGTLMLHDSFRMKAYIKHELGCNGTTLSDLYVKVNQLYSDASIPLDETTRAILCQPSAFLTKFLCQDVVSMVNEYLV